MRTNLIIRNATVLLCVLACATITVRPVRGADPSAKEILRRADEARGNADGVEWEIEVHSVERGRSYERTIRVSARNFDTLAEFLAPANMRGQKLLMLDRNMWFIKRGLSKPVPISPRQKLLGSAVNGDIASTNYAGDYETVQVTEGSVKGEPCHLFDLRAVEKRATYDRIRYWISKERLVGLKAEFYTVSGKLLKTAAFEYHNRISLRGKPREFVSKMVITSSIAEEDVTTMDFRKVSIKELPESMFSLNLLLR